MNDNLILTSLWLLPVIGLVVVLLIPKRSEASIKWVSLGFTLATFVDDARGSGRLPGQPGGQRAAQGAGRAQPGGSRR